MTTDNPQTENTTDDNGEDKRPDYFGVTYTYEKTEDGWRKKTSRVGTGRDKKYGFSFTPAGDQNIRTTVHFFRNDDKQKSQ